MRFPSQAYLLCFAGSEGSLSGVPALFWGVLRAPSQPYLLCFAGDEVADGLAEEAGQQGVEGGLLLQEAVQRLQQALVSPPACR